MSVYVDDLYKYQTVSNVQRTKSRCHMWGDTEKGLYDMARAIGISHENVRLDNLQFIHYKLSFNKRQLALENGAIESDLGHWLHEAFPIYPVDHAINCGVHAISEIEKVNP